MNHQVVWLLHELGIQLSDVQVILEERINIVVDYSLLRDILGPIDIRWYVWIYNILISNLLNTLNNKLHQGSLVIKLDSLELAEEILITFPGSKHE